jgi:ubiquinone/menaquinone biosynthesis C-methylase UbiE
MPPGPRAIVNVSSHLAVKDNSFMAYPRNIGKNASAQFDEHADSYNEAVNAAIAFTGMSVDFFTRVKIGYLVDIVRHMLPSAHGAKLLDVGCGVGNGHPLLLGNIGSLTGTDVSERSIELARKKNPTIEYVTFGGIDLPFNDERFDVVFAISVFHHVPVPDRSALVREIKRVLRSDGLFVIFEHNPRNPLTRRAVNNCEFDNDAILLDRLTCESLMATSGFQDIKTRFILTLPASGPTLRAFDRLFSALPVGAQYYTTGRK